MGVLLAIWCVGVGAFWAWSLVRATQQPDEWRWPPPTSRALRTEYLSRRQFIVVAFVGVVSSALVAVLALVLWPYRF